MIARRTPGGHYRIPKEQIERLLEQRTEQGWAGLARPLREATPLRCWEFSSLTREVLGQCRRCLAYQAEASFCFQLRKKLADNMRFACCGPARCADCQYYRRVWNLPLRLLLLGRKQVLHPAFRRDKRWQFFRTTDPYEAAQCVARCWPAVAVIDAALGRPAKEFTRRLLADPNAARCLVLYVGTRRPPGFAPSADAGARWHRFQALAGPLSPSVIDSCLPPVPRINLIEKARKEPA